MRLTTITPVTKFPKGQLMQIKASDTTTLQFVRNVGHSDARNNHRTKHNSSSQRNPTNFVHCGFQQKKSSFFFREQTKTEKPAFNRITHHRQVCQLTCESHAKQQNINRSELKEKKKKEKICIFQQRTKQFTLTDLITHLNKGKRNNKQENFQT